MYKLITHFCPFKTYKPEIFELFHARFFLTRTNLIFYNYSLSSIFVVLLWTIIFWMCSMEYKYPKNLSKINWWYQHHSCLFKWPNDWTDMSTDDPIQCRHLYSIKEKIAFVTCINHIVESQYVSIQEACLYVKINLKIYHNWKIIWTLHKWTIMPTDTTAPQMQCASQEWPWEDWVVWIISMTVMGKQVCMVKNLENMLWANT